MFVFELKSMPFIVILVFETILIISVARRGRICRPFMGNKKQGNAGFHAWILHFPLSYSCFGLTLLHAYFLIAHGAVGQRLALDDHAFLCGVHAAPRQVEVAH